MLTRILIALRSRALARKLRRENQERLQAEREDYDATLRQRMQGIDPQFAEVYRGHIPPRPMPAPAPRDWPAPADYRPVAFKLAEPLGRSSLQRCFRCDGWISAPVFHSERPYHAECLPRPGEDPSHLMGLLQWRRSTGASFERNDGLSDPPGESYGGSE